MTEAINPQNICAGIPVEMIVLDQPFREMYQLQRNLQARLGCLPVTYDNVRATARQIIYWEHCIADEVLELIEWFDRPDARLDDQLKEVQMEAIDIVHFVFNIGLELDVRVEDFAALDKQFRYPLPCHLCAATAMTRAESVRLAVLSLIRELPWKNWKTYPDKLFVEYQADVRGLYLALVHATFELCAAVGLSKQDVVNVYFAKNKENHRRQDTGY